MTGGDLDPARTAYDAFARHYDGFTGSLDYEPWLAEALPLLERRGLNDNRLLDVGCGTGKSLLPMLARGWQCHGCDISPAMVRLACDKLGERARLTVADMRRLPQLGSFDLVWSLNDSVNYLLGRDQLQRALEGMRENLADEGLLVFDLNTLLTYRTFFAERHVVDHDGRHLIWHGEASRELAPGSIATARVEVEDEAASTHVHRQRHFPEREVSDALERAELEVLDALGQDDEGGLHPVLDELTHVKALYVARSAR